MTCYIVQKNFITKILKNNKKICITYKKYNKEYDKKIKKKRI